MVMIRDNTTTTSTLTVDRNPQNWIVEGHPNDLRTSNRVMQITV